MQHYPSSWFLTFINDTNVQKPLFFSVKFYPKFNFHIHTSVQKNIIQHSYYKY